ncbi:MAG: PAS domain-containing protein [Methanospirillaceae archaeon]|nr:PAS domain-containing protein [Methanospirillaceae archaeon]
MEPETRMRVTQYLDSLPVGICTIRDDYRIAIWNRTLENWTGIRNTDALWKSVFEVVPLFADPLIKDRVQVIFSGGGPVIFSSRFHPRLFPLMHESQNEGRVQRISITPLELDSGELQAMIAVEDVTAVTEQVIRYRLIKDEIKYELEEKKKTEKALAVAIGKLNTLAAITRHDMNNILSAFVGYLALAQKEQPGETVSVYLEKMKQSADVMRGQIAFARDYQEMGNALPSWNLVSSLVTSCSTNPLFTDVTVIVETGTLEVLADALISKAVYNLLENAVRHGEHTSVIMVTCRDYNDGILIRIEDNGRGIPLHLKERIFERGFGANTGLGLFLVKEILGITGMQIRETGEEGAGARFDILVPFGYYRYQDGDEGVS